MYSKLSIQKKIVILCTVVTVLMLSIIVIFDSYSLHMSVEETYISQLLGITTAINGRYEESHSIKDVQQIFDYIEYKDEKITQLTLYGPEDVKASTERDLIGTPSPPHLLNQLHENQTLVSHVDNDSDGIQKVRLTAPLKEDGITIGAIEMLLDTSDKQALINKRIQAIMIVAITITILLIVSLWLIIRKTLILPLLKIREAALSVKQGKKYPNLELNASQEINEVASSFNEMVNNLESRYHELEQALGTLRETQTQLVESEKMAALGNLVAGVSHEINTPIGIGVTASSFLNEKSSKFLELYHQNKMKKSDLEDYIKVVNETMVIIHTNLRRAAELIKSFKQVAVDRSNQNKRSFHLKQYIEEIFVSLQPNLKKTKHHVTIQGTDTKIYSDAGTISQILTNLTMNSLIHAYHEGEQGNITINIQEAQNEVIMTYTDDGKGMPKDVRERIFDPFFTTNRSKGGSGLGLHIVYNLVTQSLGGTISCTSEVGKGTTFIIHLPLENGGSNDL